MPGWQTSDVVGSFQAERDLVVLNRSLGSKLDPTATRRGLSSKLGMDATSCVGEEERFYVSRVPGPPLATPDSELGDANALKSYLVTDAKTDR
jgi:3-polyprenyl-4-hydroxybenzoate decarboxylase